MTAERWMQELGMIEKIGRDLRAQEKAETAEEEQVRQQVEKRAWMRELGRTA